MPELKFAVDLASLSLSWDKALRATAELGLKAVEVQKSDVLSAEQLSQTALRQVRKMLDDYGLKVVAVRFRTRRGYANPSDLEARIDATKAAMRFAYSLGARVVLNQIGPIPSDVQSTEWNLLVDVLSDMGRYGMRVGAILAAETEEDSASDVARLLAALPTGSLGIDLNPGKIILRGGVPDEMVAAVGSSILAVHLTDAARPRNRAVGEMVPLGQGEADFPAILSALEQRDYRGYFTLSGLDQDSALEEIEHGLRFVRRL